MPGSGLGMCCRGTAYHSESVRRSTLWYLLQGGRLIDTAAVYVNHKEIGLAIKDAIALGIPREEIFVTTKIWPSMYGSKSAAWFVHSALKELGLDYVDLVLLHAPIDMTTFILQRDQELAFEHFHECNSKSDCWEQTWTILAKNKKLGRVRDIGVSNFNIDQIKTLQSLEIVQKNPVAVNQLAFNPWVPQWQKDVVAYCQDSNIKLTGYYTLGGSMGKDNAATASELNKIADAHNVSVFLVLARWSLQRGVAVIPGTGKPHHMKTNLQVYDFELTEAEMDVLNSFKSDAPEAPMFMGISPPKDV